MMKKSIIITAGGVGKRMGANQPKQFLEIGGKPILCYTIQRFFEYDNSIEIIVVLPSDYIEEWKEIQSKNCFNISHKIVAGGKERFDSVKNGLAIATGDLIGVHDGVRPFVSLDVIDACYKEAEEHDAAIPVLAPKESLRYYSGEKWEAVDRSKYVTIQTPQVFNKNIIVKAYEQSFSTLFTDDASVIEANGGDIHLVEGNDENIKITTPFDLLVAKALLNK